jgi:hypothetical protein
MEAFVPQDVMVHSLSDLLGCEIGQLRHQLRRQDAHNTGCLQQFVSAEK